MKLLLQAKQIAKTGSINEPIVKFNNEEISNLEILHDIMTSPHVSLALVALYNSGLLTYLIPEIADNERINSNKRFKKVWPHTLTVINQTPPKLVLRWAALFHDLGKSKAFKVINNKVTFRYHEKISAKIFSKFQRKYNIFTKGQSSCIYTLVSNLGYVEGYNKEWSDSGVRRFDRDMGNHLDDLLSLSKADITTANENKRRKILKNIDDLKERILLVREIDSKKNLLPKGLGQKISEEFDIPLGPKIGEARGLLESKINNKAILSNQDINYYLDILRKEGFHVAI